MEIITGKLEKMFAATCQEHVRSDLAFVTVEPGSVAGCHHTAVAYCNGRPVITLVHPQQVQPGLEGIDTGDWIEIKGKPDLSLTSSPEIPGGMATIEKIINYKY